jgi:hypothetical protein
MNPFVSGSRPVFLIIVLALICFVSFNTVGFEQSCQSDGCIGVFAFLLVAWGLVALQLLILIPVYAVRQARLELPTAKWVIAWAIVSLVPALIAHLYIFREQL